MIRKAYETNLYALPTVNVMDDVIEYKLDDFAV